MAVLAGSKGNLTAELLRNAENEGKIEGVSYIIFVAHSLCRVYTLLHYGQMLSPKIDIVLLLCLVFQAQRIIIEYYVYVCNSVEREIFLGILYGYKSLLQV